MPRLLLATLSVALLSAGGSSLAQQVHRCGNSSLYTDKPCPHARDVDLRPNILDAGPRAIPADPPPAPAVIPPSAKVPVPQVGSGNSDIFEQRDSRDAAFRNRTAPHGTD